MKANSMGQLSSFHFDCPFGMFLHILGLTHEVNVFYYISLQMFLLDKCNLTEAGGLQFLKIITDLEAQERLMSFHTNTSLFFKHYLL